MYKFKSEPSGLLFVILTDKCFEMENKHFLNKRGMTKSITQCRYIISTVVYMFLRK